MSKYCRLCPECQEEISYTTKNRMISSENRGKICRSCITKRENNKSKGFVLFRECPECFSQIKYINKTSFEIGKRENSLCGSCCRAGKKNPNFGKVGRLNPNFGRPCPEERKIKMSQDRKGVSFHTDESKKKISDFQKENAPMKGRSVYSVWVERYGKEIAGEKMKVTSEKHRKNATGEKNNMFGKPSPNGSGNGYSGWYNERFFRSLRELMFLIYAKRYGMKLESLEIKKNSVEYFDYNNQKRNYFGDYIVNDKYFLEIKPKRLWNSPSNLAKFSAAKEVCFERGLKFKIIDPVVNSKLILREFLEGNVKFLDRYLEKFKVWNKIN